MREKLKSPQAEVTEVHARCNSNTKHANKGTHPAFRPRCMSQEMKG